MFIRKTDQNHKLCIYKEGSNPQETEYNIKHEIIDNQIILITAMTGGGKSVATNQIVSQYKKHGYTIIYITEKESFEYANAFGTFPPTEPYHLNNLKRQKLQPTTDKIKLYHPFTFNIPYKEKLPPINFYTFNIQKINAYAFSILMTGDVDKQTVRICQSTQKTLDDNDNIWTFLEKAYKKVKAQDLDLYSYDPEDFYLPIKSIGSEKTLSDIKDGLTDLREHFFIQPANNPHNINMTQILNDNEHTHFFSEKWITNERLKYLTTLQILAEIDEAISSGKVNNPILIVIEEVENKFPDTKQANYQHITVRYLINIAKRIRQKGSLIATAQNYFSTDKEFRKSCNTTFLGKLSKEDKQTIAKDFYYLFKKDNMEVLGRLDLGLFTQWEIIEKTGIAPIIQMHLPQFANCEQDEEFITKYKQVYPENCRQNYDLYNEMKNARDNTEKERKTLLKEMEKNERQKQKEKEESKINKTQELQQQVKKAKKENKEAIIEILGKEAYTKKKNDPTKSWIKIGKETGKNIRTARKYAFAYAKRINDQAFIDTELTNITDEEKQEIMRFINKPMQNTDDK